MKIMKKLLVLLVSALTVLAMVQVVPAQEAGGSIEVSNVIAGQTYSIYRILDLLSYDSDAQAYTYTLNGDWEAFADQDIIKNNYLHQEKIADVTYVTWVTGADAPTLARLAAAWAEANNVAPTASRKADDSGTVLFSDLTLGYYLMDSTGGAICSLTTTAPTAQINEKNELTTVEKEVQEDSSQDYGKYNNAQIGETVNFKSDIKIGAGVQNLLLHDKMDPSLDLIEDSFNISVSGVTVSADNYSVITSGLTDGDTFEIKFDDSYTEKLSSGEVICVKYSALLNKNARIYTDSNNNTTWISFGNGMTSTESGTKTYSYEFDLVKTDPSGKVIKGAEFYLYDSKNGGNIIPLVELSADEQKGEYVYRLAGKGEVQGNGAVIKAGKATVMGLDAETYYLNEEKAPSGYNRLAERVEIDMTGAVNNKATIDTEGSTYGSYKEGGVHVINKAGIMLPETGGTGTMIVYIIGGIIIAAAIIIIIASRKSRS